MEEKKTLRSNRGCTPHLFAILTLTIVFLIIAKFTFRGLPEKPPFPQFFVTPTLSPTPAAKRIDISILPKLAIVAPNQPVDFQVMADTKGIQVTAFDLTINFDNRKLFFESASPSSFFPEQVVFTNEVDNNAGQIRVALGSLTPASASGTLFRLSGEVLANASGSATISFSAGSRAGAVGTIESVLGETEGARLTIVLNR